MRLTAWLVFAAIFPGAVSAAEPKALHFVDKCGERINCVDMAFYLSSSPGYGGDDIVGRNTREVTVTVNGEERTYSYVDFEIEVQARLNGGPMTSQVVVVEAYDGGVDCTGFGNITAPVVGFSVNRNPILLTSAGELELVEGIIEVGCKSCIEFVERESKSTVARHVNPAWDLTFSNIAEESFSYDDSGIYMRRGNFCVQLRDNSKFTEVDSALCVQVRRKRGGNLGIPGMVRDQASVLLDNTKSRYLMVLYHGACT